MSTRAILNKTSTKKRDTMLTVSNVTATKPNGNETYAVTDAVLSGGNAYIFPWIPTARPGLHKTGAIPGYNIEQSTRGSSICYMRGLKEYIEVQTNSGAAWQWRRLCFTLKGDTLIRQGNTSVAFNLQATNGMQRVVNNAVGQQAGNSIVGLIFRGSQGIDWNNYMNAPIDTERIATVYDKTRTIGSGNASGVLRKFTMWHPMNKNLYYDDEEIGDSGAYSPYAADGRMGMGDYYVIDIIVSAFGSTATDQMVWGPNATLYWHEK